MPPEDPQLLCKTDYRLLCHAEHVRKPFLFQDPLCYVSVRLRTCQFAILFVSLDAVAPTLVTASGRIGAQQGSGEERERGVAGPRPEDDGLIGALPGSWRCCARRAYTNFL